MHKMDSEREGCSHDDRCHGPLPKLLALGQPWICRDCGHEAASPTVQMVGPDYQMLRDKKSAGGFSGPR